MLFFKSHEDGYGAASLLGIVSIVAAGGIYLHNQESIRALSLAEKQKIRSQADLDLYSSLAVARSLFELDENGKTPSVYIDPFFVDPKNSIESTIKLSSSVKSQSQDQGLFQISGLNLRGLNISVKRPQINKMTEKDWDNIATGRKAQQALRSVVVSVDSVATREAKSGSGKFYIATMRLKASLRDAEGSMFEKKAEIGLPKPAKPDCGTKIDVKPIQVTPGMPIPMSQNGVSIKHKGPIWIALICSSVILDVELTGNTKGCEVVSQPWRTAAFENSFAAGSREIFQAKCSKQGKYNREDITVTGVGYDSEAVGRDFEIVGSGSPACRPGSHVVNGFCFYMGGNFQSCNRVCGSKGLSYDHQGTSWANNRGNCINVMSRFGKSGYKRVAYTGGGCKYFKGAISYNTGIYTTGSVNGNSPGVWGDHRVCACK